MFLTISIVFSVGNNESDEMELQDEMMDEIRFVQLQTFLETGSSGFRQFSTSMQKQCKILNNDTLELGTQLLDGGRFSGLGHVEFWWSSDVKCFDETATNKHFVFLSYSWMRGNLETFWLFGCRILVANYLISLDIDFDGPSPLNRQFFLFRHRFWRVLELCRILVIQILYLHTCNIDLLFSESDFWVSQINETLGLLDVQEVL
ncbi:hypothetical protein RhiirA4_485650 [Rhizophagus irregularis]|uniref:Uncharacterized protein n=1 Tax=Rhizophagus irregularis TaxID=588596 RepID=A0A2I1HC01_9GLOM|nr:hypothetical protein RhiirA4_476616 [Rhizophagus irregularis]PKY61109.1 hypothetical protein RhiirA4_485650 [Rhizophagus irregularis]